MSRHGLRLLLDRLLSASKNDARLTFLAVYRECPRPCVVAKSCPDDPSRQVEETVRNVKIWKNGRNPVVAATPEKSETYVFDGVKVRDREVGGSNPLAPTISSSTYGYLHR
jgi:hypothetical protein